MKKMKRLVALALSVVMVLAMSVVAFADDSASESTTATGNTTTPETYTITAPDNNHTYEVYQIFTAKLSTDDEGNRILSDVKWGKNGTGKENDDVDTTILNAIKGTTDNDTAKLAVISKYVKLTSQKYGEVKKDKPLTGVPAGYYLIKDVDGSQAGKDDSYTKYIVQVVDSLTIAPKADKPEVEKKVNENTKKLQNTTDKNGNSKNIYGDKYNDVADYNIGDDVPFHLIGKVPDMSAYDSYKYIFHDTLSAGLTAPDADSVKVYLSSNKTTENATDITNKFTVNVLDQKITVTCNNLKEINGIAEGNYIIVEYSATLNTNAVIGLNGNENEVYLEYSNNPNQGGAGDTGKTPSDKVIVFTYELDTTKVDGANNTTPLKDAEFILLNSDKSKGAKIENGKFAGWVNEDEATVLKTSDSGLIEIKGLDDGTYYLKETKAPSGYNKLQDPVEVIITATTQNNQDWTNKEADKALTSLNVTADGKAGEGNTTTGVASIKIANNKGSNLPSTGGIGTTIFYIVGGILMVGAAVLLITKRRAEN